MGLKKIMGLIISIAMLLSILPTSYASAAGSGPAGYEPIAVEPVAVEPAADGQIADEQIVNEQIADEQIGEPAGAEEIGLETFGAEKIGLDTFGLGSGGSIDALVNVKFLSGGALFREQYFEAGQTAEYPDKPAIPAGYVSFRGWYIQGSPAGSAPFDFKTPVTADLVLEARFSNEYLVQFYDGYGEVYLSKSVAVGAAVTEPTAAEMAGLPIPANKFFDFWTLSQGKPYTQYVFGVSAVTNDMNFYPATTDKVYVYFVSYGTQVPYAELRAGGKVSMPAVTPSRLNYAFRYWTKTSGGAGGDPYNWNDPVNADLTLYASWAGVPNSVSYKAVWWLEAPDLKRSPVPGTPSDYIYAGEETITGATPGEYALVNRLPAYTGVGARPETDPLLYAEYDYCAPTLISGAGNTIVNVYLKRKIYTIVFNLGSPSKWMTFEKTGQTYYGSSYSIQVKYEQDITDIWPSTATAEFGPPEPDGKNFESWAGSPLINGYNINFLSRRNVVSSELMPRNPDVVSMYTLTPNLGKPGLYTVRYWVEAYPGKTGAFTRQFTNSGVTKTYVLEDQYTQSGIASLNGKTINGLRQAGLGFAQTETGQDVYNPTPNYYFLNFYYDRLRHGLYYDMRGGPAIAPELGIMFEQPLSAFKPADPAWTNHIFKGWYKDPHCIMEFDFTHTSMTANTDLIVYAKWESTDHTVRFYDGTQLLGTQGVGDGEPVNFNNLSFGGVTYDANLHDPAKGAFIGWKYFPEGSALFSAYPIDLLVYADLNLYVNWRTDGFKVSYTVKGAGTGSVAPIDSDTYSIGTYAIVKTGPGIQPPAGTGLFFIGWKVNGAGLTYYPHTFLPITGDMTLDPFFVTENDSVFVNFNENYGPSPASIQVRVQRNADATLPGATIFPNPRPGYTLLGWQTTAGDPPRDANGNIIVQYRVPGTCYIAGTPVTLYAVWDTKAYTITERYVNDRARTQTVAAATSTVRDGSTGYRYEKTPPAITGWVAVGYAVDGGAPWYAPRQPGTPVPTFSITPIDPVRDNLTIEFLYRADRNGNKIPDEEENYTVTERFANEQGSLLTVAPPLTNPRITAINEAFGFNYTAQAPAIKDYTAVNYRVDGGAVVAGTSYAFTNISASRVIVFYYRYSAVRSDTPNINPVDKDDPAVTGQGVPGAKIKIKWPKGNETETDVDEEGNWSAPVPDGAGLKVNDIITAVQTEPGKDPSDEAQATVGGGEKPGNGKSDTPNIDVIVAGAAKISGNGVPGSIITVRFKNGMTAEAVTVGSDRLWSVSVPVGVTLVAGDPVFAVQKTGTKDPSDEAQSTVIAAPRPPRSDTPNIDPIKDTDKVVTGQGVPGATITVTWPNGAAPSTATVNNNGNWSVRVPDPVKLHEGDIVTARQKEPAKPISGPAHETVNGDLKGGDGNDGKSDTPDIDVIYAGDAKVTGRGTPGSKVGVMFKNGVTVWVTVSADTTWSVNVPAGLALLKDDEVFAQQITPGKTPSDWALRTVIAKGGASTKKSDTPNINPIAPNDKIVTGEGVPGAEIKVTWPDGGKGTAKVDGEGKWIINVPDGVKLKEGDDVIAVQKEPGKEDSDPAKETVGGGDKKDKQNKSDTPDIDEIYVGDKTVKGNGTPGSTVIVTFPDGRKAQAEVGPDTRWSVKTPDGLNLAAGDKVYAVQSTPGKLPSDDALRTVIAKRPAKSDTPNIDPINKDDKEITGQGTPGAEITITWPGRAQPTKAKVGKDGNWIANVPDDVKLKEGDIVTAVQKEPGKEPSLPAAETVGGGGVKNGGKSDTPDIDPVYKGDAVVTGHGVPGSTIVVMFPDKRTAKTTVGPDGKWSVPAPVPLKEGEEVFAAQKTGDKDASDWAKRTVAGNKPNLSDSPNVNPVKEGDKNVTGDGVPGSDITVRWPWPGTPPTIVKVGDNGKWTAPVPPGKDLKENDIIKVTQQEKGKEPSEEAQVTVGGGDKKGNGISDTPNVDPIKPGDTQIGGTGVPGSTIVVRLPDGRIVRTVVKPDGKWSVPVPADAPLKAGDTVSAAQHTPGKEPSDWVKKTVGAGVVPEEKSGKPTVNTITEGDRSVSGGGTPGAEITVTWPNGTETKVTVGGDGKWTAGVPANVTLGPGDTVKVTQKEPGKGPSDPVIVTVQRKPTPYIPPPSGPTGPSGPANPGKPATPTPTPKPTPTPVFIPEEKTPFGGVFIEDHIWYIMGYPAGDVRPDSDITRAEVAEIIYRLLKASQIGRKYDSPFPDVGPDEWYSRSVAYLARIKIIKGYLDGTFKPDRPITRAEFATMISGFDKLAVAEFNVFPDVGDHWALGYINSAAEKGWVTGYPDGTFKPENNITRAEVVTVVNRMLNRRIELADIPSWAPAYTDLFASHWAHTAIIEASVGHKYDRKPNGFEIWTGKLAQGKKDPVAPAVPAAAPAAPAAASAPASQDSGAQDTLTLEQKIEQRKLAKEKLEQEKLAQEQLAAANPAQAATEPAKPAQATTEPAKTEPERIDI